MPSAHLNTATEGDNSAGQQSFFQWWLDNFEVEKFQRHQVHQSKICYFLKAYKSKCIKPEFWKHISMNQMILTIPGTIQRQTYYENQIMK